MSSAGFSQFCRETAQTQEVHPLTGGSKVDANYPSLIMISRDYLSLWYFYYFKQEKRKMPSQICADPKSLRKCWRGGGAPAIRGPLLCTLLEPTVLQNPRRSPEKEKNTCCFRQTELWDIYPNHYMFGTFSRQPNNFNKQSFIDIIANNGRCFPAGNNGLVPLIIVIINRKSSGWKRIHAQKCSPGFGLSIFVVGDCFSLSPLFSALFRTCYRAACSVILL